MFRTCYCGSLREKNIKEQHTVTGWVQHKRDMGGVIFIDLRDREGFLQVVFDAANLSPDDFKTAEGLRIESVIAASGSIRLRDEETVNPRLDTGTIELKAQKLKLLSEADPLPFPIEDETSVREDIRLKYRFLDLRRPKMLKNLLFRQKLQKAAEDFLSNEGFICVETPILTKSTPEGARDYLVPSRVHNGTFYALPQSPQIFKQLLMVSGIDKYYQVARCFRDEDLRADRQPEFTQVDMEMSFIDQEDILVHLEKLFKYCFKQTMGYEITDPFPRLTWQEAMDSYGSDKPDLRFGLKITDLSAIAAECSFSVFKKAIENGGVVRAINVKGGAEFSRSTIDELTDKAVSYGAKGMAWIAIRENGELYSILTKYFKEDELNALLKAMDAQPNDFILFCADKLSAVRRTLGALRLDIAQMLGLRDKNTFQFAMITDFPQFEYSETEGRYLAMHHPFTMPYPEDMKYLFTQPDKVRAQAYDVVLNGIELGSGSLRIYRRDIQEDMFKALGFSQQEISQRFGFLVNAFRYGTPPHGGFAFGLDRLAMLLVGADSLREVIAFPKLKDASCAMTNAPDVVDNSQLELLGISLAGETLAADAVQKSGKKKSVEIDVDRVAKLSMLTLSIQEKEAMQRELGAMIEFADQLNALDTEGIKPTSHVLPMQNVYRSDFTEAFYTREELLANAPQSKQGFIYVPKVVE